MNKLKIFFYSIIFLSLIACEMPSNKNNSLEIKNDLITEDMPLGINKSNWIKISENFGIVIDSAQISGTVRRDADQNKTDVIKETGIATGTIFIKRDGNWYEFIQKLPPPSIKNL